MYVYKEFLDIAGNLICWSYIKKENWSCKFMKLEIDDLEGWIYQNWIIYVMPETQKKSAIQSVSTVVGIVIILNWLRTMPLILIYFTGLYEMKLKGSYNSNKRIRVIDIFLLDSFLVRCFHLPLLVTYCLYLVPFFCLQKLTKYFLINEGINFLRDNIITGFLFASFVCHTYMAIFRPS